jgi:hypothetical protein
MKIKITTENHSFEADLNDTPAAKIIAENLPLESTVNTWGDEIYFNTGLDCPSGGSTMELDVGDLGYWPDGRCLCVFFGPTPASSGEKPVPASGVVVVGKTTAQPADLRRIESGGKITVSG